MTTALTAPPPAEQLVDELARRLNGPRRLRRDLLDEVADGLTDASEAHIAAGRTVLEAQLAAVADFGPAELLAPQYQSILARGQARRTAALGAITLPVVVHGWSDSWPRIDHPSPGPAWSGTLSWITDTAGLLLGGACLVALLVLTSRRVRPERVARAVGTSMIVVLGLITATSTTMTIANLDSVMALARLGIGPTLLVASVLMLTWLPVSAVRSRRAARTVPV